MIRVVDDRLHPPALRQHVGKDRLLARRLGLQRADVPHQHRERCAQLMAGIGDELPHFVHGCGPFGKRIGDLFAPQRCRRAQGRRSRVRCRVVTGMGREISRCKTLERARRVEQWLERSPRDDDWRKTMPARARGYRRRSRRLATACWSSRHTPGRGRCRRASSRTPRFGPARAAQCRLADPGPLRAAAGQTVP